MKTILDRSEDESGSLNDGLHMASVSCNSMAHGDLNDGA
jgi:hypothetical protein